MVDVGDEVDEEDELDELDKLDELDELGKLDDNLAFLTAGARSLDSCWVDAVTLLSFFAFFFFLLRPLVLTLMGRGEQ